MLARLSILVTMNNIARIVTNLWPPLGRTTVSTGLNAWLPELDGLRLVAIAAIFLSALPVSGVTMVDDLLDRITAGYDLFLVIYAYSLTRLLIFERRRTGQLALRNYLMCRLLSLVPVSFLLIAFLAVWGLCVAGVPILPDAIGLFTLTQNLHIAVAGLPEFAPILHLGLLSALFQYGLVLPVLAAIAVGSSRLFQLSATAWLALSLAFSVILILEGWPADQMLVWSPFRPEAILAGTAIAVFEGQLWKFRYKRLAALAVLILSVGGMVFIHSGGPAGWQDLLLVFANALLAGLMLAIALMWTPLTRLLSRTPLVWTGRMFLTLFILHWPMILLASQFAPVAGLEGLAAWISIGLGAAVGTLLLSTLTWYALDLPILKLRRHYEFIEERPFRL